jgi:hypothetical protein
MPRKETESEARERRELERLLDAIRNGEIDAIEDLSAREMALLSGQLRDGEALGDLRDRLRQPGRDRT